MRRIGPDLLLLSSVFPIYIATIFFVFLWARPINLYAPENLSPELQRALATGVLGEELLGDRVEVEAIKTQLDDLYSIGHSLSTRINEISGGSSKQTADPASTATEFGGEPSNETGDPASEVAATAVEPSNETADPASTATEFGGEPSSETGDEAPAITEVEEFRRELLSRLEKLDDLSKEAVVSEAERLRAVAAKEQEARIRMVSDQVSKFREWIVKQGLENAPDAPGVFEEDPYLVGPRYRRRRFKWYLPRATRDRFFHPCPLH